MPRRHPHRNALELLLAVAALAAALAACSEDRTRSPQASPTAAVAPTPRPPKQPRVTPDRAAAADIVFRHGRIFTADRAKPWVMALAVKDGKIVAVGSNSDVQGFIGEGTRVLQLNLDFVMPAIVAPGVPSPGGSAADAVAALSPAATWASVEEEVVAVRGDSTPDAAAAPAAPGGAAGAEAGGAQPSGDLVGRLLMRWTIDNARAAGRDAEVGSITVGKRADILILNQHPYFALPHTLSDTKPVFVIADGKVVLDEMKSRKHPQ